VNDSFQSEVLGQTKLLRDELCPFEPMKPWAADFDTCTNLAANPPQNAITDTLRIIEWRTYVPKHIVLSIDR
jgi:hypothetical protein